MVERLSHDPRIISAARLGEAFHTDPIQILNCTDDEWILRMAAAHALSRDQKEAERKAKAQRGG